MMGRPVLPAPEGFEEVFVRLGWEAKDALGIDTPRFRRALDELGRDRLRQRRKNYVMGNRLNRGVSSLKLA